MLISKGSREDAIHALINTWMKDARLVCGQCGERFEFNRCCKKPFILTHTGVVKCESCGTVFYPVEHICCPEPFISDNAGIFKQFVRESKRDRATRKNKYAAMKGKAMRWKLSFPLGLQRFLDVSMQKLYSERLFTKEYDTTWFAKKFGKYFQIPEVL